MPGSAVIAVTLQESDEMCDVMPASQRSERVGLGGLKGHGGWTRENEESQERGAVERLSRDLAEQAVKRSGV